MQNSRRWQKEILKLNNQPEQNIGVLLVLISAITFSTAGLFTKGVDAGAWEVIFWRGFFAAFFTVAWLIQKRAMHQNFVGLGQSGLAIAIIGALGTAAFISSFKLTTIANVSLIYAASPLLAALLAWVFIGERVTFVMMAGSIGALLGVGLIVSGSLGQVSLNGDLLALIMAIAMASIMVIYRKFPETPGAGPAVLSSVFLLPLAMILGEPFAISLLEVAILGSFGFLFAIASVTLAEGAKRIPAGQTALLSTLETPIALMLAFLFFTEIPSMTTVIGGILVLAAVLLSIKVETK